MTTATQIVEAEIGPQGDIGDFVKGALRVDFLLNRLAFQSANDSPFVYDKDTGKIVCYIIVQWVGHGMELPHDSASYSYRIDLSMTFNLIQSTLKRDPGYSHLELNTFICNENWFSSWQSAVRFFLSFEPSWVWLKEGLLIEASRRHIDALAYTERLDSLVQELAKRDFFTEKVDRRAGKGTSCYLLGQCGVSDPSAVAEVVRSAGALSGLIVENPQAAMRNERTWQIDFQAVNLFESIDNIGDFVTTAFREEVPGYAELERIQQFRDTLRSMGLPIYALRTRPEFGGEISYYAFFDNRQLNLSKTKTANIAAEALRSIGYGSEVDLMNRTMDVSGHGAERHVFVRMKALKPQALKTIQVESEDGDYAEFGEIAAAKSGTIGDEVRLKRLVRHLKAMGFTVKEASMQQQSSSLTLLSNYLVVEYRLGFVWHPKLPLIDDIAREHIRNEVAHFLNVDRDLCGAKVTPLSNVRVEGRHNRWNMFTVTVSTESLRRPVPGEYTHLDKVKLQLESDLDDYGEVAISGVPGLRTRMWLKKLRASLESKKLYVRSLHVRQWDEKLQIAAHINAGENSFDLYHHVFTPAEIIKLWYQAVKETGNEVVWDAGEETRIVSDSDLAPMVYTVKGFVKRVEGDLGFTSGSKLSESTISVDDAGVEEHERLWAIATTAERESQTNSVLKPVAVLCAQARPVKHEDLNLPEGTVYIRMRFVAEQSTDAIYSFNAGLSKTDSKRVIVGARFPTFGLHKSIGVFLSGAAGLVLVDMYAYVAPVGPPLDAPITVRGPSSELWPQYADIDESSRMLETFDPEDEVWVRQVITKTPGYRDMARLKSAVRSIEEMGLEVTGVTQQPHMPHKPDTVCDVTIAIKKTPTETSTQEMYRIMPKIRLALEAYWDILDLRHEYDTTDGQHTVWLWKWHSYEAPKDITSLHLRYGSWNDYAESGLAYHELDSFLVEQYDEPGDEEDLYLHVFHGAQEIADPLWRERLRVQAIADFIKARGYGGSAHLAFDPPTLYLAFTNPDPQKMDSYFTKDLLHALNNEFQITSPGNVWAYGQDLRRSFQNDYGQPESRCNLPYMFANNTTPEIKPGTLPIHVNISLNEAIEFTPKEMAGFGRVAARPDKLNVVQQAWQAFIKCAQENHQTASGWANYLQEPGQAGISKFEFMVKLFSPTLTAAAKADYDTRRHMEDLFRDAVLKAGLSRYKPRRTLYFKWPVVNLYVNGQDSTVTILCKFSLRNLTVPDKAEHISNVHAAFGGIEEGMSYDEIGDFVRKALPGLNDQVKLQAMLDQWASLSRLVAGGVAWGETDHTSPKRRGKHRAYIEMNVLAKENDSNHVHNVKGYVQNEIIELLANHGYGRFTDYGIGGNTLEVHPLVIGKLGRWGWYVKLRGVVVDSPKFPGGDLRFGELPLSEDLDPEEFGMEVIRQTDPAAETIGRFQAVVRSLKQSHWDWIQDGTMKIGGGQSGVIFCYTHFLFKPGQEKPREFVTEVTRQALTAQRFQIEKLRCVGGETPGSLVVMAAVSADASWIVKLFPEVFIDFDTVQVSESLKEGMIDPDEFVKGSEQGTKHAVFRNLNEIAANLKQNGWIGYLHARNWQGSGNWHDLTFRMNKAYPNDDVRGPGESARTRMEAELYQAIRGMANEPLKILWQTSAVPGYPGAKWHWRCSLYVDLGGRCNKPDQAQTVVVVDIQTGAVALSGGGYSIPGAVGPGQPA